MGGRMAGMALDDFLMPFAAMALTHQLMDAKKRKDQQQKLAQMGIGGIAPRNQGISYNPLLMR
jgi:hypothetical protein